LEERPVGWMSLEQAKRFHYLYQRASADLARVATFAAEPAIRGHLESLVSRAYGEVHRQPGSAVRASPLTWFSRTFPQTFRRRIRAFAVASAVTLGGCIFGAGALLLDRESKPVLMPFSHLLGDPAERVAQEERNGTRAAAGPLATFSAELMTNNIQVSINALALGMTWGVGTIVILFYNGVGLGAVVADYIAAGQGKFVAGWLLPHGSIEIPAILIGGQAGLALGGALIGWGRRLALRERLRAVGPDLATLVGGVAVILVWAGLVEAFLSQFHEPVLPYAVKIAFGVVQLTALVGFLAFAGRGAAEGVSVGGLGKGVGGR